MTRIILRVPLAGLMILIFLAAIGLETDARAQSMLPESGLDPRFLARADNLPRLRSLLISLDGKLIAERYFNGARASQAENLKSASKSILSALVGIALDRGYLKTVHEPMERFFPEHLTGPGAAQKKSITIEDLLTMRSGLEGTSNVNYGQWVQSGNWVRHVLSRPLVDEPGGRMIYSTGNSHLLSALLTKAAKMSTFEFARRYLAEPLGFPLSPWARDPQGIYFGGNDMHWTPRGMIAFGELYLHGGRVGNRRILSETWIKESLKPRTRSHWSGREYGYGWWIDSFNGHPTHYAWGHGGQFIFVVPSLKLVVAATSIPLPGEGRREHQHAIYELMEHDIVPSVEKNRAALKPVSSTRQVESRAGTVH